MKTCKTCKWYDHENEENEDGRVGICYFTPPPYVANVVDEPPDMGPQCRCSKWETKQERKCANCDFYYSYGEVPENKKHNPEFRTGECRRNAFNGSSFPMTNESKWCGEFKGRE